MFEDAADRQQMLAELRRRMAVLGPGREKIGAALQGEEPEPTETVVGSGRPPRSSRSSSARPTPEVGPPETRGAGRADSGALSLFPSSSPVLTDPVLTDPGATVPGSVGSGTGAPTLAAVPPEAATAGLQPAAGPAVEREDLAFGQVHAVPEPLRAVLPQGGLPKGGVVSLAGGAGSTSLMLSLLAAPEGAWSALVGLPGVGLIAAAEFGVDLDRTVLIPDPGPDVLQVLSVLADGVDLIVVGAPAQGSTAPARLRTLTGRLRQRGATLLVVGAWPGADLVLRTRVTGWAGIEDGHGRLRDRSLEVTVGGRRAAGSRRSVHVLLRGDREQIQMHADPAVAVPVERPEIRAFGT